MPATMYDRYFEDLDRKRFQRRAIMGLAAFKATSVVISHPIEYGKTLIQLGYEPIPPFATRTLMGKQAIGLPGIFSYLGYIKERDGILGLWRGLHHKLVVVAVHSFGSQLGFNVFDFVTGIPPPNPADEGSILEEEVDDEISPSVRSKVKQATNVLLRDCSAKAFAVVLSQPFHVMTVRCMAQFVGRETKYSAFLISTQSVIADSGWKGFFSGLVPRLVGELATITLTHALIHAVRISFPEASRRIDKGMNVTSTVIGILATSFTYPLTVVGNCMAVSASGLVAGSPPYMPHLASWTHAWTELSRHNQLDRGSSVLKRYYKGSPNLDCMRMSGLMAAPSIQQFRDPKAKLL